MNKLVNIKP